MKLPDAFNVGSKSINTVSKNKIHFIKAELPEIEDLDSLLDDTNVVCFSHLRWNFVYQRPQHLLSRLARKQPILFFEEPMLGDITAAHLDITQPDTNITVLVPKLPHGLSEDQQAEAQGELINDYLMQNTDDNNIAWYYTPMAMRFTEKLKFQIVIYDCMDELSHFAGAHPDLVTFEKKLLHKADLIFTGGETLYKAKKNLHDNVYSMPSSIDRDHFGKARTKLAEPADQAGIPHPRAGFFGVIDERLDISLLSDAVKAALDIHFVMIGPVVKISEGDLPRADNIHYLGPKSYQELPSYLAHWDVSLLPFALNESTKYISPTKTPEYLAGGKPVVSTPIADVVHPYGEKGLVAIAKNAEEFVAAINNALSQKHDPVWKAEVDYFLSKMSWDITWESMRALIEAVYTGNYSMKEYGKYINNAYEKASF